jgi:hypothetical protein
VWIAILAGCSSSASNLAASSNDGAGADAGQPSDPPTGARCAVPAFPPREVCAGACGNGRRDSCNVCTPLPVSDGVTPAVAGAQDTTCGGGSELQRAEEECEGSDLGGTACEALGFPGGTLGCTPLCSYETSHCQTCVPGPHSLACRHTELDAAAPSSLALAAGEHDFLLAWVSGPGMRSNAPVPGSVRVARFGPDLQLLGQTDCFGPPNAHNVALVRTSAGYVLAVDSYDDGHDTVLVQPLDATGARVGAPRTLPGSHPALFERRTLDGGDRTVGGPLLVWFAGARGLQLMGQLLDDRGRPEASPAVLYPELSVGRQSAVFTGDGFLVDGTKRLALDGTVTTTADSALGGEYPALAWVGSEGRLAYEAVENGVTSKLVRIDAAGRALSTPLVLPGSMFIPGRILASGDDTIIAFGSGSGWINHDSVLRVGRFSRDGTTATAPFDVVADPEGLGDPQLALMGSDVIVAWVGGIQGYPGRIGLARVAP